MNVTDSIGARSLASMFDLAPDHAHEVAEVLHRRGESYDADYGTFGVIACNLGDPNLDAIEAAGWPLGVFDAWLRHDERRCRGCEFCERMHAYRLATCTDVELREIEQSIRDGRYR